MVYSNKPYASVLPYFNFCPRVGVVKTTPLDRALGRFMRVKHSDLFTGMDHFDRKVLDFAELPVFRDLLGDAFFAYYLTHPGRVDPESLPPEYRISQLLLDWMTEQPDAQTARTMTTGSSPASVAAAIHSWRAMLSDEAFESLRKALEQLQAMSDAINDLKNEIEKKQHQQQHKDQHQQEVDDFVDSFGGSDEEEDQSQQDGDGDAGGDLSDDEMELDSMQSQYDQRAQEIEDAVNRMMNNPITDGVMREIAKDAHEKTEEMVVVAQTWGLDAGDLTVLDMMKIMELSDQSSDIIEKLTELVGRTEEASNSALERVRESYVGNPSKLGLTQDFSKILPTEMIMLSDKAPKILRTTKVLDWASQGLLGWVVEGEGKSQGSFIAYVDGSWSMRGDRILAAKAIAFGIANTLRKDRQENREFVIKLFGSEEDGFVPIDSKSSLEKIAEWATYALFGGTDFTYCFKDAIEEMKNLHEQEVYGIDLLFITDGQADLEEEQIEAWKKLSENTGARLMLVLIERQSFQFSKELEELADLVIDISTYDFMNDIEKVADQIAELTVMPRKEEEVL
jgi:uncharacterized protein with von Willebrand factor type A (vWA) domain